MVWKLDRLGSGLLHLLWVMGDLQKRGVAFRLLTEAMDTATSHGELLFSALAQFERRTTREHVIAGFAAAKRRDRCGGRLPAIEKK